MGFSKMEKLKRQEIGREGVTLPNLENIRRQMNSKMLNWYVIVEKYIERE